MFDTASHSPDLTLLLGPHDRAVFLGTADWRTRAGRVESSMLYVVLHRRGPREWSQACRIVPDGRPGHLTVHVERIAEGDRCVDLAAWFGDRLHAQRDIAAPLA
jgi:hypothetical protein